jgi:hypothetical protein
MMEMVNSENTLKRDKDKMVTIGTLNGGNIVIIAGGSTPSGHTDTRVTYTSESGLPDWSGEIEGTLTSSSIPNILDVETIDIGTSVTGIGSWVFSMSQQLTSVTIGSGVTYIGVSAFEGCEYLTSMIIPSNVEFIDEMAFYGTSFSSLVFQGKTL